MSFEYSDLKKKKKGGEIVEASQVTSRNNLSRFIEKNSS
jgi:hypothetical protein